MKNKMDSPCSYSLYCIATCYLNLLKCILGVCLSHAKKRIMDDEQDEEDTGKEQQLPIETGGGHLKKGLQIIGKMVAGEL